MINIYSGRPKKRHTTKVMSFSVNNSLANSIDKLCEKYKIKKSTLINNIIYDYLCSVNDDDDDIQRYISAYERYLND